MSKGRVAFVEMREYPVLVKPGWLNIDTAFAVAKSRSPRAAAKVKPVMSRFAVCAFLTTRAALSPSLRIAPRKPLSSAA